MSVFHAAVEQCLTVPLYCVGDGRNYGGFEKLPRHVLAALVAAEADTAVLLRHWLAWRMSAGARGWTAASIPTVAAHLGVRPERVSMVLAALSDLDVVSIVRRPGRTAVVSFPEVGHTQTDVSTDPSVEFSSVPVVVEAHDDGSLDKADAEVQGLDQDGCVPVDRRGAPTPDLSDHPPLDCRMTHPRSVGHVLDAPLHTISDSVAKPVETLTRRARSDAAAVRPNSSIDRINRVGRAKHPRRLDAADRQAMRIVAGLVHLAGQPKLRGQARQRISVLLRRYPNINARTLAVRIDEAFSEAASSPEGLGIRHMALINQTLANLRADQLAAPSPDLGSDVPLDVSWRHVRTVPAVVGPCLVDLIPTGELEPPGREDDATDWAVGRIAAYVVGQEPHLQARALELYPQYLQRVLGGHYPEISFATQVVARALANQKLQASGQTRPDGAGDHC